MNNHSDDVAARLRHSLNRGSAPELSTDLITRAADRSAPRLINPALRIAGGATIGLATLAIATLVVVPALQPAPLFTSANAAPGALGSAEAISSDMRMGMWVEYEYTAGAGLSTSGGNGSVYQLVRTGDAEERASTIAAALGVAGEPVESTYSTPEYPTWIVGPEDGSAPSVSVTWSGTGDWWFNDPSASPRYVCEPADAVEPSCVIDELPVSEAPSEAEARALAHELFATSGFDVAESDIRIVADEWQTTAAANLVVDGVETALEWGVGWSNTGALSWAYGHSITVENRGAYGTISATAAVDRLADGRWWGAAGPDYQGGMIAFAAESRVATGLEGSSDVPTSEPVDPAAPVDPIDPADPADPVDPAAPVEPVDPVDPGLTPEPVDPGLTPEPEPTAFVPEIIAVTIDEAESTLLLMWDSEGNAWLVPGFAMLMPEGWWTSVVSLVPGVIEMPEPTMIEPFVTEVGEPAVP